MFHVIIFDRESFFQQGKSELCFFIASWRVNFREKIYSHVKCGNLHPALHDKATPFISFDRTGTLLQNNILFCPIKVVLLRRER
jgi:hypothetical protein